MNHCKARISRFLFFCCCYCGRSLFVLPVEMKLPPFDLVLQAVPSSVVGIFIIRERDLRCVYLGETFVLIAYGFRFCPSYLLCLLCLQLPSYHSSISSNRGQNIISNAAALQRKKKAELEMKHNCDTGWRKSGSTDHQKTGQDRTWNLTSGRGEGRGGG